jgi:hypothetical protein
MNSWKNGNIYINHIGHISTRTYRKITPQKQIRQWLVGTPDLVSSKFVFEL